MKLVDKAFRVPQGHLSKIIEIPEEVLMDYMDELEARSRQDESVYVPPSSKAVAEEYVYDVIGKDKLLDNCCFTVEYQTWNRMVRVYEDKECPGWNRSHWELK